MIVVWSEPRQRFEAVTSYMERDIPRLARWSWDKFARRWFAPSEDVARRLREYAQGTAALRLANISPAEREALAASTASDSDIHVPSPAGLTYLPYQRAGIAYALTRFGDRPQPGQEGGSSPSRGGVLIADEMG